MRAMARENGRRPALDWFDDLDDNGQAKVEAACRNLDAAIAAGRPPGSRWTDAKSKEGLRELRVTPPGAKAPHLRALGLRRGNTIWLAAGFTKQKNKLEKQDVALGDSITRAWKAGTS